MVNSINHHIVIVEKVYLEGSIYQDEKVFIEIADNDYLKIVDLFQ